MKKIVFYGLLVCSVDVHVSYRQVKRHVDYRDARITEEISVMSGVDEFLLENNKEVTSEEISDILCDLTMLFALDEFDEIRKSGASITLDTKEKNEKFFDTKKRRLSSIRDLRDLKIREVESNLPPVWINRRHPSNCRITDKKPLPDIGQ